MDSYTGLTALVTGASKGLGEEIARDLARRGANLVLVARSEQPMHALAEQLRQQHGSHVEVIAADLSERDAAAEVVSRVDELEVTIDLLVNNAGIGAVGPFLSRPLEPNLQSLDVNVCSLTELVHRLGARMLERGQGGIINIASVAAFQPMPFQASYGASKAFVLSFTEAVAEEVRGTGLRVMASHPGPTATSFFDHTTVEVDPNAVSARKVAVKTLDDFARGKSISIPGRRLDRFIVFASRIFSRTRMARLAGNFNRKSGRHEAS